MDSSSWSDPQFWCDDCYGALPFNLDVGIDEHAYCSCDAHYIVGEMLEKMCELVSKYADKELGPKWEQEPGLQHVQPNKQQFVIMMTEAMLPQMEKEINSFWELSRRQESVS